MTSNNKCSFSSLVVGLMGNEDSRCGSTSIGTGGLGCLFAIKTKAVPVTIKPEYSTVNPGRAEIGVLLE